MAQTPPRSEKSSTLASLRLRQDIKKKLKRKWKRPRLAKKQLNAKKSSKMRKMKDVSRISSKS